MTAGELLELLRTLPPDTPIRCISSAEGRQGRRVEPAGTVFRVFAPSAREVKVVISDEPEGSAGLADHHMLRAPKGVWEAEIPGDLQGKYYAYKLSGAGFEHFNTQVFHLCHGQTRVMGHDNHFGIVESLVKLRNQLFFL